MQGNILAQPNMKSRPLNVHKHLSVCRYNRVLLKVGMEKWETENGKREIGNGKRDVAILVHNYRVSSNFCGTLLSQISQISLH